MNANKPQTLASGHAGLNPGAGFQLSIASPETIRGWSYGEVTSGETIDYKTLRPFDSGLFCESIFGRVDWNRLFVWENNWEQADWECSCRTYRGIEHLGVVCRKCEKEVTIPKVRRERMGHIELAIPICHIWFLKNQPSPISQLLGRSVSEVESVINFAKYLVIDPGSTSLELNEVLGGSDFAERCELHGEDAFVAEMGSEAIHKALSRINLPEAITKLRQDIAATSDKKREIELVQRLRLHQSFLKNGVRPEWMILKALPVLPPGLRPLSPLPNGKFVNPDINWLYKRVIVRNESLKEILERNLAPADIVQAQKRSLQQAVNELFENGHHGLKAVVSMSKRPLKPLANLLNGKTGRFRQNLLGKRVDFSGRSVIVVGPELKLHQCGLPKEMALVLFEPFLIHRLMELGHADTKPLAKAWIKRQPPEIWDILDAIMQKRLVLLNRAPTLHRLSIQAFEPVLIEGKAIRIHPLVCTAYNADFDGDQMAVHVPLSDKALNEARRLMMPASNLLSPSSGRPIVTPTQDIVLGCYYLTLEPSQITPSNEAELPLLGSTAEVVYVAETGVLKTHDRIRFANPDFGQQTAYGDAKKRVIVTTVGRVFFSEIWPAELGLFNRPAKKADLSDLIGACYRLTGPDKTLVMLDKLKEIGFRAATKAGVSIGIGDMLIPEEKNQLISEAAASVEKNKSHYTNGLITSNERRHKNQDIWRRCSNQISKAVERKLKTNTDQGMPNPLWLMLDSGARGSSQQVVQLAGLRGLMVKANGEIMEKPILSNFREGLSPLEFFSSTHGARKGTSDTSLKTANAGYLSRKLVSAALDVLVREADCGTALGRWIQVTRQNDEAEMDFVKRVVFTLAGRVAAENVLHPQDPKKVLLTAGQGVDLSVAREMASNEVVRVKIRSILTCESRQGVCATCYGDDMATGHRVKLGEAVGIVAAQSIGEPGTQLTMRTFHTGGVATDKGDITGGLPRVSEIFEARRVETPASFAKIDGVVSLENGAGGGVLIMVTNASGERAGEMIAHKNPRILVEEGGSVVQGQRLTDGKIDPHDLLKAVGPLKFQELLVDEVLEIYRLQGVAIQQKHIEIIFRQMLGKVRIIEPGDTQLLTGEVLDRSDFLVRNKFVADRGGQPAEAVPVLLGITQVALRSNSFLSAASFQNTSKILSQAAILSKRDSLQSLKACVMAGKPIPAGTGFQLQQAA